MTVQQSTWKFLRRLSKDRKQYAVIGLGRFGSAICRTLHELGHEVLGIDHDHEVVNAALESGALSHGLSLDTTDYSALQEAGVLEFDVVIVAIGSYIEASIITTLNLKEGKVPHVISKASTSVHGKLLERVGADLVIFPEDEMGAQLARSLTAPAVLARFDLSPDHSLVEVHVPSPFIGQSLSQLALRSRYNVTLLAIQRGEELIVNPHPDTELAEADALIVVGENQALSQLPQ
ncbi:potassium channel family protein [Synechococcus elongatus]|uniref:TrkA family potassium uptake protein n=2 Tax=Synechococcus elongatus TaxID=32046 RepID=Q31PA8_SYNE7|nr:TrkA family potassium uptake protein [Synechococcus elongatus]ABB57111.1 conserved hypothetical protein [Synechococcus elongatus PCC 7942 = FACHB-805]AJD58372.1 potassium transporter [Synechococcus elongatus UTEX 2973]MBD2587512.1 TrkA family potassium uptake protein [Synechococcus elongatus FACHB-242]MBD2688709.1 TrkA family potassium uptake protein [Synechococcus elongatus FACHB-1061]MBD2707780.1 TrkA family potassium uptake protein [Synechococcus elongatus PCC 7942 = FACHB-805]